MAEDYITPYQDPEYWDKHINGMILKQYSDIIQGEVLDVGCNHGAETILISRLPNVTRVEGIDINPEAIRIATKRKQRHVWFFVHDIAMPWRPLCDTIICFHTLEHIEPDKLDDVIENLDAILIVGGHLIISVPYLGEYPSEYHHSQFDEISLKSLFHNFEILECYRDQRVDGHGNQHDIINLVAKKI